MTVSRKRVKRRIRHLADRVIRPYVDEVIAAGQPVADRAVTSSHLVHDIDSVHDPEPASASTPFAGVPSDYFHAVLHELRTIELGRVPKGSTRALSVGANGRWYFDWFENAVGPLERHIGIEAFEPEPTDLPGYVTWIPNTADHMDDVATGEVDLVFAGQTTEHLWAHELSGFLSEAHRVLTPGGILVLDSPNRLVTERLDWSHGGHTVELTAGEIGELVALAGFDLESVRGVWRCRFGDQVMQLEDGLIDGATIVHRVADGPDHVDDSFVWWLVARRSDRLPDHGELSRRTDELFRTHWPTRISRGLVPATDADSIVIRPGQTGVVGQTLPFPVHAGRWRLELPATCATVVGFEIRLVAPGGHVMHRLTTAEAAERTAGRLTWDFTHAELTFAMVLQLAVDSVISETQLALPIALSPV